MVTLTDEFKEYTISLEHTDLSYISSAFGFIVSGNYNKESVVFYLDDIKIDFPGPMPKQPEKVWVNLDNILPAVIAGLFLLLDTLLKYILKNKEKKSGSGAKEDARGSGTKVDEFDSGNQGVGHDSGIKKKQMKKTSKKRK